MKQNIFLFHQNLQTKIFFYEIEGKNSQKNEIKYTTMIHLEKRKLVQQQNVINLQYQFYVWFGKLKINLSDCFCFYQKYTYK